MNATSVDETPCACTAGRTTAARSTPSPRARRKVFNKPFATRSVRTTQMLGLLSTVHDYAGMQFLLAAGTPEQPFEVPEFDFLPTGDGLYTETLTTVPVNRLNLTDWSHVAPHHATAVGPLLTGATFVAEDGLVGILINFGGDGPQPAVELTYQGIHSDFVVVNDRVAA